MKKRGRASEDEQGVGVGEVRGAVGLLVGLFIIM